MEGSPRFKAADENLPAVRFARVLSPQRAAQFPTTGGAGGRSSRAYGEDAYGHSRQPSPDQSGELPESYVEVHESSSTESQEVTSTSIRRSGNKQAKLIQALRMECDKLLQMECPSTCRTKIVDTVNCIIQNSSRNTRTRDGDNAARSLPYLLKSYADQCQKRLEAERNSVTLMREREKLLATTIAERNKRIDRYKMVVREFEEAQYNLASLQETQMLIAMDNQTYREHCLAILDAKKHLESKREQCNRILQEHSACQRAADETNKILKMKVEEKERELKRRTKLATEELGRVTTVTQEIRRITNESFGRLKDDLSRAKDRLENCSQDMTDKLTENRALVSTCDAMLKLINQNRNLGHGSTDDDLLD